MTFRLTTNEYHGWHRGAQGIRASILNESGEVIGILVGIASGAGSGGGREYSIHDPKDARLECIAKNPKGALRFWFSRKELQQELDEIA